MPVSLQATPCRMDGVYLIVPSHSGFSIKAGMPRVEAASHKVAFVCACYEAALSCAVHGDWLLPIQLLSTLVNGGLIYQGGLLLSNKSIQGPVAGRMVISITRNISRTLLRRGMSVLYTGKGRQVERKAASVGFRYFQVIPHPLLKGTT